MNPGPLHPLSPKIAGQYILDRLHYLGTVDGIDIWWDPEEINGLNYLAISANTWEWVYVGLDSPDGGLRNVSLRPVLPFTRNHHSLTL